MGPKTVGNIDSDESVLVGSLCLLIRRLLAQNLQMEQTLRSRPDFEIALTQKLFPSEPKCCTVASYRAGIGR